MVDAPNNTVWTPKASAKNGAASSGTTPALIRPKRTKPVMRPRYLMSARS